MSIQTQTSSCGKKQTVRKEITYQMEDGSTKTVVKETVKMLD